jgi:hypothetical protein
MLDLAFVRANLPLVEEKLRARNMDPAQVLGDSPTSISDFTAITQLNAQLNRSLQRIRSPGEASEESTNPLRRRLMETALETERIGDHPLVQVPVHGHGVRLTLGSAGSTTNSTRSGSLKSAASRRRLPSSACPTFPRTPSPSAVPSTTTASRKSGTPPNAP